LREGEIEDQAVPSELADVKLPGKEGAHE